MSRPQKDGLDYFPLDCDFFESRKIRILRKRFGPDGVILYLYILTEIYRWKGYYVIADDDFYTLISDDLGMSMEKVLQIMKFLFTRPLLVEIQISTLGKSDTIITAKSIQEQYQKSTKERGKNRKIIVRSDLWLLNQKETADHIKVEKNHINSESMTDYSEETHNNNGKNTESKVKEIIEDRRREEYPLLYDFFDENTLTRDEQECLLIYAGYFKPDDIRKLEDMLMICRQVQNQECVIFALDKTKNKVGVDRPLAYIQKVAMDIKAFPEKYKEQ